MAGAATLDEIKDRIRKRVGKRSPFHLMDPAEAEGALAELTSLDADAWAEAWSKPGARWEKTAREAEAKGNAEEAKAAYFQAAAWYGAGRHPFPSSSGKQEAYRKTIENYLAASRYFDPPLERIALPLRDKEVVGYLRLPAKRPAPVIMHWGGIDNWKEERHSFVESMLAEGWGCFIMDSPGTYLSTVLPQCFLVPWRGVGGGSFFIDPPAPGASPVLASDTAHEVYTTALDHLVTRPEVDSDRIAALGASFGGYWSTKLAHVEPERLRAAVNWGGGIHGFFQPGWQRRSRNASS
ncbi:MAG: alpha/beta fold hydrolase, partial [Deltaproteobacteria bacterium]|nr:alpha/beta fold hydrolase [Deltaproteobacteria bacterium]